MLTVLKLEKRLICGMEEYFQDSTFSDCVVESAKGQKFHLHRIVLAKSSEVFKAMLTSEMKEGETRLIQVSERYDNLRRLFELIYTGKTTCKYMYELTRITLAANKYLISDIEDLCVRKIKENIIIWNVVDILKFAYYNDFKSSKDLKEMALSYIGKNFASIRKSLSWVSLVSDPELMTLAIDSYIQEKEPQSLFLNHF